MAVFQITGSITPNFDRMQGNPICCQIPWQKNDVHLRAWTEGRTGYPFIDAVMRQLRKEGWIHHLARHAVACFLTRGDLWISWEDGQKVFEEFLLDADWALNAGNWMWLSASAFFHQFYRVYSPVSRAENHLTLNFNFQHWIIKCKDICFESNFSCKHSCETSAETDNSCTKTSSGFINKSI